MIETKSRFREKCERGTVSVQWNVTIHIKCAIKCIKIYNIRRQTMTLVFVLLNRKSFSRFKVDMCEIDPKIWSNCIVYRLLGLLLSKPLKLPKMSIFTNFIYTGSKIVEHF